MIPEGTVTTDDINVENFFADRRTNENQQTAAAVDPVNSLTTLLE